MGRKRKQKPDLKLYKASIESLSHEGRGIARIDGKTTFIHGALPGETVMFQYVEKKRALDVGDVKEVISPSEKRVVPICPHFEICGGCSLQHLSNDAQLLLKEQGLKDQFEHFAKVLPKQWLSPLQEKTKSYRHKARLSVRHVLKKGKVLIGFRERFFGRFIADMDVCKILHPKVGEQLPALKGLVQSLEKFQFIAQIEVAIGDKEAALIFRNLEELTQADVGKLQEFGRKYEFSIYLQPAGPDSVFKIYPEDETSKLSYRLESFSLSLEFEPTDFTQVNPSINQKMVELSIELLELSDKDSVLDLFCGLGNFSLPIARKAKNLVGVEGSALMIERAKENAKRNGLQNSEFHEFDLTKDFATAKWFQTFDKILIDPPRSGAKEIVSQIEKFKANTIVYVACSPATLARDAGILVHEKGYTLQKAGVMDMFPHTSHIESIALFTKK